MTTCAPAKLKLRITRTASARSFGVSNGSYSRLFPPSVAKDHLSELLSQVLPALLAERVEVDADPRCNRDSFSAVRTDAANLFGVA